MTDDLERALLRMPASGFKARLWAELERRIATMTTTVEAPVTFGELTPYLIVQDVDTMLDFYAAAFGAQTLSRDEAPRGIHSSFRIGDTRIMMGGPLEGRKAMLHLYVDDLEETLRRALSLGAVQTYPVTTAPYGETFAVVDDLAAITWILAERGTSTLRHQRMGTVTPYLNASNAAELVTFLEDGMGAEVLERHDEETRGVAHCKMGIGGSVLELSDPSDRWNAFTMMFYLYVDNVDDSYARALKAGATSIHPPAMQHYGEYVAAFTDPVGNQWYVARSEARRPDPAR